jgi:hypothetical protein
MEPHQFLAVALDEIANSSDVSPPKASPCNVDDVKGDQTPDDPMNGCETGSGVAASRDHGRSESSIALLC